MINTLLAQSVISCVTSGHHPLNLSDHLPLTLSVSVSEVKLTPSMTTPKEIKINWSKAMSEEAIQSYAQVLHTHTTPLLDAVPISVNYVEKEIQFVSNILISTAEDCQPPVQSSNRHFVHDSTLSALCKLSKIAWKKWKAGGRPSYGPLHDENHRPLLTIAQKYRSCTEQAVRKVWKIFHTTHTQPR